MKKFLVLSAIAVLAGCGSDNKPATDPSTTGNSSPAATSTSTADPAATSTSTAAPASTDGTTPANPPKK